MLLLINKAVEGQLHSFGFCCSDGQQAPCVIMDSESSWWQNLPTGLKDACVGKMLQVA